MFTSVYDRQLQFIFFTKENAVNINVVEVYLLSARNPVSSQSVLTIKTLNKKTVNNFNIFGNVVLLKLYS